MARVVKTVKPILVTGSHRSGTTWVGRMIAASGDVAYIHEPFNIEHDIGICKAQFDYWFTYVCKRNEREYFEDIKDTIEFRYNLAGKLKRCRKPRDYVRAIRSYARVSGNRRANARPLLKDPLAIFSAAWLSATFDTNTVVMIRHPAAFAGSLKVKHWTHPFSHFLAQPLLMEDLLYPFEDEIGLLAETRADVVDQAAMLWKLIHYTILKYKESNPDWIYVRHEDLSQNPVSGFRSMYGRLGLDFSERVSGIVDRHSSGQDSRGSGPEHEYRFEKQQRNSASNITTWKSRLTPSEIDRLKSQVWEISKEFYTEEEW